MNINFFDSREQSSNLKCTIHKTGNLGFTKEASDKLNVDSDSFILIGFPEGSNNSNEFNELYMVVTKEEHPMAFKVYKAGDYYFIKMKYFFDKFDFDYKSNTIIYDLIETNIEGNNYIKMVKRVIRKNKKGEH